MYFHFNFIFAQKEFDTLKIYILQTNVQNSFIMCIFQFVQKIIVSLRQTMLIGGECSSIDVDIWVNLDGGDPDTTGLEDHPQTAGDDALPNPTDDSPGHQHILHGRHTFHDRSQDSELQNKKKIVVCINTIYS